MGVKLAQEVDNMSNRYPYATQHFSGGSTGKFTKYKITKIMRIRVLPYKIGSASGRLLSRALGGLCVRPDGRFRPRAGDFIINWGSGSVPAWWPGDINNNNRIHAFLNHPRNVSIAANKLHTFNRLREADVSIPEFTTDVLVANGWLRNGNALFLRHTLTGHSGEGIQVARNFTDLRAVPRMIVKAIQNHGEYRVHVVNGEVIDYIKKRRHNDDRPTQNQNDVRNLANGWVYTRQNLRRLERIETLAVSSVSALGLDFGAVDIIMDENGEVYTLEVNTACGMSDTTLNAYVQAFTRIIDQYA